MRVPVTTNWRVCATPHWRPPPRVALCTAFMAVSLPPCLRMRPSITTVSTFDGCAAVTSMWAGSPNTPRLTSRVETMMRSARLPALSEPTLSAMPIERAPSMVPSSSTRRAVSLNSFSASPFSRFWTSFMMPNMSALPVSSTVSTDRPTGMPAARNLAVCCRPKPMRSSENGDRLTASARLGHGDDLLRRREVGMDHLHIVAEQAGLGDRGDLSDRRPRAAGVDRDRQAEPAAGFDLAPCRCPAEWRLPGLLPPMPRHASPSVIRPSLE